MRKKLTRREFLKLLFTGFANLGLFALGGAGYGMLVEPTFFKLENIQLKLKRLPASLSGIRIAQLSDIHMGGWMNLERFKKVAALIADEEPDLLLITGDFVFGHNPNDSFRQALKDLTEGLSPLAKSIPSFAVLGNHDYWTDVEAVREMLSACGITDLTNTSFAFSRDGAYLHLCGVDDVWEGNVRLEDVIASLPDDGASILLAHEPDFADTSAPTGKFDLQISGHSHGGQIVIPFFGPPVLPRLGLKYPSGLYQVGGMYQYTNRGVGMGRIPVRVNCPPEITIFQLESLA